MTRMMAFSKNPPKYPAMTPRVEPMTRETATEHTPMIREYRAP